MKLQSKLLGGRFGKREQSGGAGQTATAVAGAGASDGEAKAGSNLGSMTKGATLRSLGSELQQAAQQSTFDYSKNRVMITKTVAAVLVMLAIAHAGLVLIPMSAAMGSWIKAFFSWTGLGLALEITALGVLAAVIVNMFPALKISPQGLGVAEVTGWRTIPWKQVGVIRVMELSGWLVKGRYLVMIPFTGKTVPSTPAPMLKWIPTLMGAAREGEWGVMITSDIKNFERLLQLSVSYMVQASGGGTANVVVESFVDEDVTMNTAQLLLDPEAALERLSRYTVTTVNPDLYGVSEVDTDPPVNWPRMLLRQLPIALLPPLMLITDVLVRSGDRPLIGIYALFAALLLALGMAELPFVAYLIQSVGELMVGGGKFKRALWAYAELQIPRAITIVMGLSLLGIGLPSGFAQALWLAGITITTLLTARFVQKLYYMPVAHTILAAIGVFIYQLLILTLYFWVR